MGDTDNKVDNKLDFRNVKHSQLGGSQIERAEYSELQSAKRVYSTNAILNDAYTHFIQTTNVEGLPTYVEYWQATGSAKDKLQMSGDLLGSKAGTYFTLQEYTTKKTHVFWYRVSGSGAAPGIGDTETPIDIVTNDNASLIARATAPVIEAVDDFKANQPGILSSFIEIEYLQFGETAAIGIGTSGFTSTRLVEGCSFKVGKVSLSYDVEGSPIYGGNVLKGLRYNPYTASFDTSTATSTGGGSSEDLISNDAKIINYNIVLKDVEESIIIPDGTKKFTIKTRNRKSKLQLSYVVGESDTNYITLTKGAVLTEENVSLDSKSFFVRADKDDTILEILIWK